MSSRSLLSELQPLPKPVEYLGAFEITEESFGEGGSWENIATQMETIRGSGELYRQFTRVALMGQRLLPEDLVRDYPTPTDESDINRHLVGTAYAQGFYQQLIPSQLIYGDIFNFDNAIKILQGNYDRQDFTAMESDDVRAQYISGYTKHFAEQGLAKAGEEATAYIHRWAESTHIVDKRLQQAFVLGHGAMMTSGLHFQEVRNDFLIRHWLRRVNLDDEIELFLSNDEGENKSN